MSELYLFTENDGSTFGFTPTVFKKTLGLNTYIPTAISRSTLTISDNFAKNPINIRFHKDHIYARKLLHTIIEYPIKVNVFKNGLPFWEGRVVEPKQEATFIDIRCDSATVHSTRGNFIPTLPLHCRHKLYSPNCGVIQDLWGSLYTATSITNGVEVNFTSITEGAGHFDNGTLKLNNQTRRIIKQTETQITISYPIVTTDLNTILYPGCALSEEACVGFNNLDSHGGISRMPISKNPFRSEGLL